MRGCNDINEDGARARHAVAERLHECMAMRPHLQLLLQQSILGCQSAVALIYLLAAHVCT